MDQELIAYLDARFRETSHLIKQEVGTLREETTQQIQEVKDQIRETRVLVEHLESEIRQVAEGVVMVNEKLDRSHGVLLQEIRDVRSEMIARDLHLAGRIQKLEERCAP